MLSFTVYNTEKGYLIGWQRTQDIAQFPMAVPKEIAEAINMIADYIDAQKSDEEIALETARTYIASLTDTEKATLVDVYPKWQEGQKVDVGYECQHLDKLYRCLQAHVTQADWEPQLTPALWQPITTEGVTK